MQRNSLLDGGSQQSVLRVTMSTCCGLWSSSPPAPKTNTCRPASDDPKNLGFGRKEELRGPIGHDSSSHLLRALDTLHTFGSLPSATTFCFPDPRGRRMRWNGAMHGHFTARPIHLGGSLDFSMDRLVEDNYSTLRATLRCRSRPRLHNHNDEQHSSRYSPESIE